MHPTATRISVLIYPRILLALNLLELLLLPGTPVTGFQISVRLKNHSHIPGLRGNRRPHVNDCGCSLLQLPQLNSVISQPPILVNRFMLNLRQIDDSVETLPSAFSDIEFRAAQSLFGNFGEPLEHGASLFGEGGDDQAQDTVDGRLSADDDVSRTGDIDVPLEDNVLRESEASASSVGDITEVHRTNAFIS